MTAERTNCIRRRYQSLHESIDSVPGDRSTIRHSIYNKHQTCTAVCRQVVHESKCNMRHSIYACFVQTNSTISGKYTLVYRTSETMYFLPQWSTYEHSTVYSIYSVHSILFPFQRMYRWRPWTATTFPSCSHSLPHTAITRTQRTTSVTRTSGQPVCTQRKASTESALSCSG